MTVIQNDSTNRKEINQYIGSKETTKGSRYFIFPHAVLTSIVGMFDTNAVDEKSIVVFKTKTLLIDQRRWRWIGSVSGKSEEERKRVDELMEEQISDDLGEKFSGLS